MISLAVRNLALVRSRRIGLAATQEGPSDTRRPSTVVFSDSGVRQHTSGALAAPDRQSCHGISLLSFALTGYEDGLHELFGNLELLERQPCLADVNVMA